MAIRILATSKKRYLLLCYAAKLNCLSQMFTGRAPRNQISVEIGKLPSKCRDDLKDTHKVWAQVSISRATGSNTDGDLD